MTSCMMCDSLYVKANGEMPCWCDAGDDLILDRLTTDKLSDPSFDLFNHPQIRKIRQSFHIENSLPFPEICARCGATLEDRARDTRLMRDIVEVLHIEASWLCNLDCPQCVPLAKRTLLKNPPYNLDIALWNALIANLRRNNVKVQVLHFEGRGDPLMHRSLADLCSEFHEAYPLTPIMVTTNANFEFDETLLMSGVRHLRVSVDGVRQESYSTYRRRGKVDLAMRFMRDAAEARRRLGLDVLIEWKYILFEWNDSDGEMLEAYRIANELGVELSFCLTETPGKSRRFDLWNLQAKINKLMPEAKNRPTVRRRRIDLATLEART
jgi:molybdenum cofactor biosynthesis enzyme MoaA